MVVLDLDPEVSSPPVGCGIWGLYGPFGTLRVEPSVWPLAGPARDLNMDPKMGPNWGIGPQNWVKKGSDLGGVQK